MKFSRRMELLMILKCHKKQSFTLSLENTFLEKHRVNILGPNPHNTPAPPPSNPHNTPAPPPSNPHPASIFRVTGDDRVKFKRAETHANSPKSRRGKISPLATLRFHLICFHVIFGKRRVEMVMSIICSRGD